jgi:peptidoglycan hydrolase CwlO-like protein
MPLQDLMAELDTQLREHNEAKAALDTATAALEAIRKTLQDKQGEIDADAAKEKSELEDVRAALTAVRDEADRQLAALGPAGGAPVTPGVTAAVIAAAARKGARGGR